MQITFRLHTALAGTENGVMATTNVQVLPSWAPPIEYIGDGTTGDWLATMIIPTSAAGSGDVTIAQVRVLGYGRSPTLRNGRDCIMLDQAVGTSTTTQPKILTLTYRAVGEIVRP